MRPNDQLVSINDVNLRGLKNEEAMNLIGRTTQAIGRNAASIRIGVLRVVKSTPDTGAPVRLHEMKCFLIRNNFFSWTQQCRRRAASMWTVTECDGVISIHSAIID